MLGHREMTFLRDFKSYIHNADVMLYFDCKLLTTVRSSLATRSPVAIAAA